MSVTDRLIELGKHDAVLFHTPDDTCFAAIKLGTGGYAIYPLNEKSKQLKKILRQRYYKATGKAPQADALKAAIGVLEGIAAFDGAEVELHNRVAWRNGSIVYDLTNSNFEAIEIRPDEWGIMPHGHIIFRRFGHQTAQVNPVHGGDVWRLFEFVNVPESDRLLVMVYLISCLVPGIAHVIPIITGEQGAAKTTSSRLFKLLIDPSALDVISLPGNEDRMHQLLSHHWFVIFDNISYIQRWQSDAMCRASTGQATNVRTLYTDDDDTIFKYKMCIGLNGINNAATNSDLLDRAFFLNLYPIPTDQRIEEKPLFERFNAAKPEILCGMFDALSKALKIYPSIELNEKPRMADFAVWGCAIAEALGYTQKEFLDAYYTNIGQINREALAESVIGNIMLSFMEQRAEWESTPTELHNELEKLASAHGINPKSKAWVKTPRSLGKRLREIAPNLRKEGIAVEFSKSGKRHIRITNTLYNATETSKTPITSADNDFDAKPKRPQTPITPNTTHEDERANSQTPKNDKRPTNAQKKPTTGETVGHLGDLDVSAPTLDGSEICGKCGRELDPLNSFRGPAGLGSICADCQQEIDRQHGFGADRQQPSGEELLPTFKDVISKLGYARGLHEFTSVQMLMEMPKGLRCTVESVEAFLAEYTDDLQIRRTDSGKWQMTA